MKTTLTRAEVRDVDRRAIEEFGVPGIVLMENAGRGVAEILSEDCGAGPVVICCGKGNNGGDGFVIARHLELRGIAVEILLFCEADALTGDAATNYRIASAAGLPITICADRADRPSWLPRVAAKLAGVSWVVDALLGTGAVGEPRRRTLRRSPRSTGQADRYWPSTCRADWIATRASRPRTP
ncbi:MAG: NAD(P)H-hydrate epimerase [Pirellulales bacterium]